MPKVKPAPAKKETIMEFGSDDDSMSFDTKPAKKEVKPLSAAKSKGTKAKPAPKKKSAFDDSSDEDEEEWAAPKKDNKPNPKKSTMAFFDSDSD